ncbi:MAG: DegT/DnrJ/EryC1/StrS family aminotransferase [Opitutaceae bacterium]|nr:DegT/DnrJ/EryC1/StrS family aminotransferase [Opitutaceae bacterium]
MKKAPVSRRTFLGHAASAGAGLCLSLAPAAAAEKPKQAAAAAARGVTDWPKWDNHEEQALLDVLRSGKWGRGNGTKVKEFEAVFAERMRAKYCIATSSGTTALLSAIGALNVGPGDEVILPPYTFVATFNVITANFALPVFADVDADSFQIDPARLEAAITPATRLLLPVHIGGSTCELDAIAGIAQRRQVPLLEDACQAPGAEWRGQPVGTKGIGGCFSFQASKNLTSGEGGAVVTNDEAFAHQVYNFHTPGTPKSGTSWGRAANYRLTEFQAALLLAQYRRFNAQQDYRNANAEHLSAMLRKIPGIAPAKLAGGNNRSAWHLYMFRYDAKKFSGLSRARFLQELNKTGIGASSGYSSLNTSAHVKALAANPHYQRIYGKDTMAKWVERNRCPVNDRVIEEAVWLGQTKLLDSRSAMEQIAETIAGIQKRSGDLARA